MRFLTCTPFLFLTYFFWGFRRQSRCGTDETRYTGAARLSKHVIGTVYYRLRHSNVIIYFGVLHNKKIINMIFIDVSIRPIRVPYK